MAWTRRRITPSDVVGVPFTYPEVGATATDPMPAGYRRLERSIGLGRSVLVQRRAVDALLSWRMHRAAGLRVDADGPTARPGAVAVLTIGWGALAMTAPCRVVHVVDEPHRGGFAYGTLPGHPETGEEAFLVERDADGTVTFTVRTFSRPATLPTRAATPLTYLVQDVAVRHYLRTLRRLAYGD